MTKNIKPGGTQKETKPKRPGYNHRETMGKLCAILMNGPEM